MKSTSSVSAKAIQKMALVEGSSGTLPTGPVSASISEGFTEWTVTMSDSTVRMVRLPGENGRISFSADPRSGGNVVRFYRDSTTKIFDAVLPGVWTVWSNRVDISEPIKSAEIIEREERNAAEIKAYEMTRIEKIAASIVKREYSDDDMDPFGA